LDTKLIRREFERAQAKELKAFEKKEKKEAKALKAAQSARRESFEKSERDARRQYFAQPHPGVEKRAYMKQLLQRRADLKKEQIDERAKYQEQAEARLEALVDDQQKKRELFDHALKKGERPADSLWPQPGIASEP
jgi:hypothetical protein